MHVLLLPAFCPARAFQGKHEDSARALPDPSFCPWIGCSYPVLPGCSFDSCRVPTWQRMGCLSRGRRVNHLRFLLSPHHCTTPFHLPPPRAAEHLASTYRLGPPGVPISPSAHHAVQEPRRSSKVAVASASLVQCALRSLQRARCQARGATRGSRHTPSPFPDTRYP